MQRCAARPRLLLIGPTFVADLRDGLRGLRRNPVFCLTSVLTLAIGIGANTAVFTLLYGLLLRSLPVAAPQDLARAGLVLFADLVLFATLREQMDAALSRCGRLLSSVHPRLSTACSFKPPAC